MDSISAAVAAIEDGKLVVYPTETVYGLGGNALDPGAIDRVFAAKDRPRTNPMAMAVPSIDEALAYVDPDDITIEFMEAFLPGPVTVVCPKRSNVPDELTGGRDQVGIRVPDYTVAQQLLAETPPLTATSANVSGMQSIRDLSELEETIRRAIEVVIDDGQTPGGASTVVDVSTGRIHRHGRQSTSIQTWLQKHVE